MIQVIQWFYLDYSRTFYHHISFSSGRKQEISLLNSENKLWGNLCSNRIRKLIQKLLGASLLWGNIEWWKRSTDEILHVAGYDHTIILVSTDKSLKSVFALKLLLKVMMLINITVEWLVEFFFHFYFLFHSGEKGRDGVSWQARSILVSRNPTFNLETELHSSANCQRTIVLFISNSNTTLIYFSSLNNLLFLLPLFFSTLPLVCTSWFWDQVSPNFGLGKNY